jgi:hypothetical protein
LFCFGNQPPNFDFAACRPMYFGNCAPSSFPTPPLLVPPPICPPMGGNTLAQTNFFWSQCMQAQQNLFGGWQHFCGCPQPQFGNCQPPQWSPPQFGNCQPPQWTPPQFGNCQPPQAECAPPEVHVHHHYHYHEAPQPQPAPAPAPAPAPLPNPPLTRVAPIPVPTAQVQVQPLPQPVLKGTTYNASAFMVNLGPNSASGMLMTRSGFQKQGLLAN